METRYNLIINIWYKALNYARYNDNNNNIIGKTETQTDKLKSILSQLHYKYLVEQYEAKGISFCSHLYVPEVHPITEMEFHEREDEGHVFKVCVL